MSPFNNPITKSWRHREDSPGARGKPCLSGLGLLGVNMVKNKVTAVSEWSGPDLVKQLQRFLGFANFYRRFILDFSSVAAPLNDMLKGC